MRLIGLKGWEVLELVLPEEDLLGKGNRLGLEVLVVESSEEERLRAFKEHCLRHLSFGDLGYNK